MLFTWKYLLFLLAILVLYYAWFKKSALLFLNITSLCLIAYWSWVSAVTVVVFSFLTYRLAAYQNKWWSYLGIFYHLLGLLFIKANLFHLADGASGTGALELFGFSYFALQNIALLLDSGKKSYTFNEILFGSAFFAKFIAGPILVAKDFSKITLAQEFAESNLAYGIQRILLGLAKKIILADRLAIMVNNIYSEENATLNGFSLLMGTLLFTLQMYLDFSAYSDIAIGTAKLFGYDLKENFRLPLRSATVTEYWRRTHISLIEWLTQYVYYPLTYKLRTQPYFSVLVAITISFVLSGMWHGIKAGYIIWGGLNALFLMIEYSGRRIFGIQNKWKWLGVPLTLILVSAANFFFKAGDWANIIRLLVQLDTQSFFPSDWMVEFVAVIGNGGHFLQQYNLLELAVLLLSFFGFERQLENHSRKATFSYWYLLLIGICILFFGSFNAGEEFIYVQF